MSDRPYVYLFREGNKDQKELLGGKGANLAEMTNLGLPVPPGFTITTQACVDYLKRGNTMPDGVMDGVRAALRQVEEQTGKMDTILDLGLNDATLKGLIDATGDARFAYDSWRRFVMMFGDIVLGIERDKFTAIFDEAKQRAGTKTDA